MLQTEIFSEISEEEIFEAVQDAAVEDESDSELEDTAEAVPTRQDVLQAAAVIKQFTATTDTIALPSGVGNATVEVVQPQAVQPPPSPQAERPQTPNRQSRRYASWRGGWG